MEDFNKQLQEILDQQREYEQVMSYIEVCGLAFPHKTHNWLAKGGKETICPGRLKDV